MNSFKGRLACLALAAGIGHQAEAISRVFDIPDQSYLNFAAGFPYIGMLQYSNNPADKRTAALIGDKWILSAGHNMPGGTTTATFAIGGQVYNVSNWVRHPNYNGSNIALGFDISVAKLSARVTNVAPIPLYTSNVANGTPTFLCGFGAVATGSTTQGSIDGNKRAGTNTAENWPDYPNIIVTDFDSPAQTGNSLAFLGSSAVPTSLECGLSGGDSGGVLIIQDPADGNKHKAVATASFTARIDGVSDPTATKYGAVSGFSKFTAFNATNGFVYNWIAARLVEAGGIAGKINLGPYAGPLNMPELSYELRNVGATTPLEQGTLRLNVNGTYSLISALRGNFDLAFKGPTWLREVKTINVTSGQLNGVDFVLINGDVNGDNEVNLSDYDIYSPAYDTIVGDANWDQRADLDGDGAVTLLDYDLFSAGFDMMGKP